MDSFTYQNGQLFVEGVPAETLADAYGTPTYVYSRATLLDHFHKFRQAFAELNPIICFSIKSLQNLAILRLLREAGSGFDVVSGGELYRALRAGADPAKIVFAGVGKSDSEIREALHAGIGWFNVESEMEFENVARLAQEAGQPAHGALRINPDVEVSGTHVKTITGKKTTKFGVDIDRAEAFIREVAANQWVRLDALHIHLGSPIYKPEYYVMGITKVLELIDRLEKSDIKINTLDIGGGFAAYYEGGEAPSAQDYAAAIVPLLRGRKLQLIIEPGRSIACNAGLLLTRVQYLKHSGDKQFVIVDAAMNDLIRPTLYEAYHFIWPTRPVGGPPPTHRHDLRTTGDVKVDVVGPICESGDYLAKDRYLPPVSRGDLLAVFSTGAYGAVMGSRYNSRPMPAEVLVNGNTHRIIRKRENYDDLIAGETM